ncbi:MAG: hypothetical protein JW874_13525 [Spirochaetales bacterium]|nr:hypothetical protein [Spirochaetales bacterium]
MEQPDLKEQRKMNEWFAVQCSNHAWDIASKENPTEEDFEDMLMAAYAAQYHWSRLEADINLARIDMLLSHVHSHMRNGQVARKHSRRALEFCENHDVRPWDLAFSHAEMAYACAVSRDEPKSREHLKTAREISGKISDSDERNIFLDELESIEAEIARI